MNTDYKHILIKTPNWLGDAVMSLPVLKAVRYLFPESRIAVLSRSNLAELFKYERAIDDIIPYEDAKGLKKIGAEIKLIKHLKNKRFDLVIILPRSFHSALVSFLTKITHRVGYASEGRGGLLTQSLPRTKEILTQHRVYYFLNLLSVWSANKPVPFSAPQITTSPEEEKWATGQIKKAIASGAEYFIAINPGATYGDAKCWPTERFVELSKKLLDKYSGLHIVIIGGPNEAKLGNLISRQIDSNRVIDFTGQTSILQLTALLKKCKLLVTNDTGPMHVSAAVGTPVAAIFGPTDTSTTGPFGNGHSIICKKAACAPCLKRSCPTDHKCMRLITVEEVFQVCKKYL
ncbi:MAG: lipopolysaccharide heptosyltransferase II [Candidatus Brocadiia bacterium]